MMHVNVNKPSVTLYGFILEFFFSIDYFSQWAIFSYSLIFS